MTDGILSQLQDNSLDVWYMKEYPLDFTEESFLALEQNQSLRKVGIHGEAYVSPPKEHARRFFAALMAKPTLDSLHLTCNVLPCGWISQILAKPSLTCLLLNHCIRIISVRDTQELAASLERRTVGLVQLELRNLALLAYAQHEELPRLDPILRAITDGLHFHSLTKLVLGCLPGTCYSYHGPLYSLPMLEKLVSLKSLQDLELQNLRLTNHDLSVMAQNLGPALQRLRLSTFRQDEIHGIVELVHKAIGLQVLTIEGQCKEIQEPPLEEWILPRLRGTFDMQELCVPGLLHRDDNRRRELEMLLQLNRAGRSRLEPTLCSSEFVRILEMLANHPSCIFYVLQRAPYMLGNIQSGREC